MANSFGRIVSQFATALVKSVVDSQTSTRGSGRRSSDGRRSKSQRSSAGSKPATGKSSTRSAKAKAPSESAKPTPPGGRETTVDRGAAAGGTQTARTTAQLPGPGDIPKLYSVADLGMPDFEYAPDANSRPDPGEVVWTWVPYEEDRSQGKDRPVVVVAECQGRIVFAQLTSKDHHAVASREARSGRMWVDVGAGSWDRQGRPSEARIDRLLCVHPDQMRREGGRLDESRFTEVIAAIRAFHG